MDKHEKLLRRIMEGRSDNDVPFKGLCALLLRLGFVESIKGSHHIFRKRETADKINIQAAGKQAKPYQIRQVRRVLRDLGIGGGR